MATVMTSSESLSLLHTFDILEADKPQIGQVQYTSDILLQWPSPVPVTRLRRVVDFAISVVS